MAEEPRVLSPGMRSPCPLPQTRPPAVGRAGSLQSKDGVWHVRDERVGAAERGSENPLRMRPRRGGGEGYKCAGVSVAGNISAGVLYLL